MTQQRGPGMKYKTTIKNISEKKKKKIHIIICRNYTNRH